jgi:Na+-driven multidrug efflux pump
MLLYITLDSTKCITLNILRSTGRPSITVAGNIIVCLVVLLPGGYYLGLQLQYGLMGLWTAMSAAWLVATVGYLWVIYQTDWKTLRVHDEKGEGPKDGVITATCTMDEDMPL